MTIQTKTYCGETYTIDTQLVQSAQASVARLERAQASTSDPQVRRRTSDERVTLMAAIQRYERGQCDAAHLRQRIAEAQV